MQPEDASTTLTTPRLRLLPAHEGLASEVAVFYRRNSAHLAPWDPPTPTEFFTEAFQRDRLRKAVAQVEAGAELRWWLEPAVSNSILIGSVSLTQIARGPFQNAMLGYSLDAAYEGQGYMREALQAAIAHAFSAEVHLHRIQANVRPENSRSVALLRRLGFEEEGRAREYLFIDGDWRDHFMFAVRNTRFEGSPDA